MSSKGVLGIYCTLSSYQQQGGNEDLFHLSSKEQQAGAGDLFHLSSHEQQGSAEDLFYPKFLQTASEARVLVTNFTLGPHEQQRGVTVSNLFYPR